MQPETPAKDSKADGRRVLLSIDDLHVWFELRRFGFGHAGYVKAVDGVSFDLHTGEAIAVVGESGCGKSSLMKTILALYKPTRRQGDRLRARIFPSWTPRACTGTTRTWATCSRIRTARCLRS